MPVMKEEAVVDVSCMHGCSPFKPLSRAQLNYYSTSQSFMFSTDLKLQITAYLLGSIAVCERQLSVDD